MIPLKEVPSLLQQTLKRFSVLSIQGAIGCLLTPTTEGDKMDQSIPLKKAGAIIPLTDIQGVRYDSGARYSRSPDLDACFWAS